MKKGKTLPFPPDEDKLTRTADQEHRKSRRHQSAARCSQRRYMGASFGNQDASAGVRYQVGQRLKKSAENEVHAKVLDKTHGGLAQGIGFGPRRPGQGQILCDLIFRLFLGGD